jgi:phosphoglycerate dehydrogenase-like enzyme
VVVKVASVSFSKDPILRAELAARFPAAVFNDAGVRFKTPELQTYLADADAAVIGLEKVDDGLLAACPRLRMIAKYGVGLDGIDLDACRARGVVVGWTPGVNRRSVAELALCFLLGLFRNVFNTASHLRGGTWNKDGGRQLTGATIGIVGLGHVGRDLVGLLKPFGCRILANDIVDISAFANEHGIEVVEKDVLFRESDAVSLHVPLTPLTRGLINPGLLEQFKPGAFLVNTSRGEVVEQASVKQALLDGRLGGAALDVFEVEPPTDAEFLAMPVLVGTPNIGGNAREAILAMGRSAIAHLDRFFPPSA